MKLGKTTIKFKTIRVILFFMLIAIGFIQVLSQMLFVLSKFQMSLVNEDSEEPFPFKGEQQEKAVLRFAPEINVPSATMPLVTLLGLQSLPENILVRSKEKRKEFKYSLEPERIIGKDGLLAIREFQGNSWSGLLMKGALVFFVQSKASHYRRRMLLRKTWASIRDIEGLRFETVFVLSTPTTEKMKALLLEESREYKDILQYIGEMKTNVSTSNSFAGLQWAAAMLPEDFFYAFVGDDTLVNLVALHDVISQHVYFKQFIDNVHVMIANDGSALFSSQKQIVHCLEDLKLMEPVERNANYSQLERSVSNKTYSAQYWPPYCTDGLYIIPVSFAKELYEESRWTLFNLPDELHDVLITGILRRKLNRGDSNIASVSDSSTGIFMMMRFPLLSRSSRSVPLHHKENTEEHFKLAWSVLYKLLLPKFHVYTPFDNEEKFPT